MALAPISDRIREWARNDARVRLVILGGSRGRCDPAVDCLSDYDVSLFVTAVGSFAADNGWYEQFGPVMLRLHGLEIVNGEEVPTRGVIYAQAKDKVKFSVYHVRLAQALYASHRIPEWVKLGYQVLLDKDTRAYEFKRVGGLAFVPGRPRAGEYATLVNEFWWETTVVAKHLFRGDLLQAKFSLDYVIRCTILERLLAWETQIGRDWRCNPGKHASRSRELLPPLRWSALRASYAGGEIADNWRSLFDVCEFFRRGAQSVAAELGFTYPAGLDSEVTRYLQDIAASTNR